MYTYGWFMMIYCRNQHNIVKQYPSIKINKLRKKKVFYWGKIKFSNSTMGTMGNNREPSNRPL